MAIAEDVDTVEAGRAPTPRAAIATASPPSTPQAAEGVGPMTDSLSGLVRRHHASDQSCQRVFKLTVGKAGITKPATPHTLRRAFAAHLLQSGYDIRTVQAMLGNSDVATTMIYTQVLKLGAGAVRSPLVRYGCRSTSGIPATAPGCARPAGPGSHERLLRRPWTRKKLVRASCSFGEA